MESDKPVKAYGALTPEQYKAMTPEERRDYFENEIREGRIERFYLHPLSEREQILQNKDKKGAKGLSSLEMVKAPSLSNGNQIWNEVLRRIRIECYQTCA